MPILPLDKKNRSLAYLFMILAPLFIGGLALCLGQDANWDFRNYHWYNAYAWLTDRYDVDLLPAQKPSFYNPILDVPLFMLGQIASAKITFFTLGMVQGLNIILLFLIAQATLIIPKATHKFLICAGLALMGMLGGGGIALIGTTFYDNVTSLGFLLSVLLALRFWKNLHQDPLAKAVTLAFVIGLPAGLALGLKLVAISFAVGLCFAFLFMKQSKKRVLALSLSCGLGITMGVIITLGPWAWHLWEAYQNPLFPHFNQLFASPLAPLTDTRDVKFLPHGLWAHLSFPFLFSMNPLQVGEIEWQDFRIPILYALTPIAFILRLAFGTQDHAADRFSDKDKMIFLMWLSAVAYLVWLMLFGIYRYLIPLEMLAPLLIVLVIGIIPLPTTKRIILSILTLLLIVGTIQAGNWGRAPKWLDKAAPVTIPTITEPHNLMVLMTSYEPYAHIIPSFPAEIAFVRIQSNFTSPEMDVGFNTLIKKKISAHQGLFKALIPDWSLDWSAKTMKAFNLQLLPENCLAVKDHLYDSKLVLCNVKRIK